MESLKRALENIGRMWANLNITQRIVIGGAAALMVVLLVVSSLGTSPEWVRVAGPGGDLSKVTAKLQERHQKFEVRGTEVFVPKEDAERVFVDLAGEGAGSAEAIGKFLEQSDIFATRWDKEKRLQILLQTRLEGIIRSIESIKNATIVINPGSTNHQLGFVGPKASASVQVELKEGMVLSRKNVQAIAGLVARAVSGVDEDQVLITDTKANAYRVSKPTAVNSAIDTREHEKTIEDDIRSQIKDARDFWGASVVVRIQTNTTSKETDGVKYGKAVPVKTSERTVRKGPTASPAPRIKKGEGDAEIPAESSAREQENSIDEENKVDEEHIKQINPAGDIQRVTVGVLIPVDESALAEKEKQLPKLRDFVLKAAGPQARMEDISVQLIPTKAPTAVAPVEETVRVFSWLATNWTKLALGLLTVVAVLVVIRVINRSSAQDTVEELQALTTALTETREAAAELGAPVENELARLRQGIQEMAGRNPQAVAASLKSFMTGR